MLGADTDTDKARPEPTQERGAFQQPDGPGGPRTFGLTDAPADLSADHLLQSLREPGGEGSAALYFPEIFVGDRPCAEWACQYVGCGDSVLNGQIDSNTSYGRHGVGSIADAQQAGAMPLLQTIDLDGQQLHIVPVTPGWSAIPKES